MNQTGVTAGSTGPRFYSVAAAAALLGTCAMTLYRAINAGEFPAIQIRGRYVIPALAIDQMESGALANGLVNSADFTGGVSDAVR